jgi:hypothetical protein
MSITMIGLDTAKSVFQVHAMDGAGQVVPRRGEKPGRRVVSMTALGVAAAQHGRVRLFCLHGDLLCQLARHAPSP